MKLETIHAKLETNMIFYILTLINNFISRTWNYQGFKFQV